MEPFLEGFFENFHEHLLSNFRIVDVIDIAAFSVCLYFLLKWFWRNTNRPLSVFLLVFLLAYGAARSFDLYLVLSVFKYFFSIALIALVVLFQAEIRRNLERLLSVLRRTDQGDSSLTDDIDEFVESVASLQADKVGALFVFTGKEPLSQQIHGGIPIATKLNKPLIRSIFDSRTPGHDGAMILTGPRISKFACQLPLSRNRHQTQGLGTRHSAALGLSERSDAMVVVVSEETGYVSVARDSHLEYNVTLTDLKNRLEYFLTGMQRQLTTSSFQARKLFGNGVFALIALLASFFCWSLLTYEPGTVFQSFTVPVEYRNLDPNLSIQKLSSEEIKVTLSGSRRAFRRIQPEALRVVLDFDEIGHGNRIFRASDFELSLPTDIGVFKVSPPFITAKIVRTFNGDLPVKPVFTGRLDSREEVEVISIDPPGKACILPYDKRSEYTVMLTKGIDVSKLPMGESTVTAKVVVPTDVRLGEQATDTVTITIRRSVKAPESSSLPDPAEIPVHP